MDKRFPTEDQLRDLANRLRGAYREACEAGECDCITTEEHERMLAGRQYKKGRQTSLGGSR